MNLNVEWFNEMKGEWINEFNSVLNIQEIEGHTFKGTYSSTTGATGKYNVVGIFDPSPVAGKGFTIAFSISWKNIESEEEDMGSHWVSGFTGEIREIDGLMTIITTYILTKNTILKNSWNDTVINKATFKRPE